MSYHELDPSAKGFLKDIKTGVIFPVFERETIKNTELMNIDLKKKGREFQITHVVVSKDEYLKHVGYEAPKVENVIKQPKNVVKKQVRKTKK